MAHLVSIDPQKNVLVDGVPTGSHLTRIEERLLRAILGHSHCASKEFLMTAVYAGRDEPYIKLLDLVVCNLRAKLGSHRNAIATVWGRGWAKGADYSIAADAHQLTVGVDASLIEEVSFVLGKTPEEIIERLLLAERDRLCASEAA